MTITPIDEVSGTDNVAQTSNMAQLVESLREQDEGIRTKILDGLTQLDDNKAVPDHLRRQLAVWEKQFTAPHEREMVAEVKRLIQTSHAERVEYMRSQVESKVNKMQFEIALKGLGKATSGIQSLLSAQ